MLSVTVGALHTNASNKNKKRLNNEAGADT